MDLVKSGKLPHRMERYPDRRRKDDCKELGPVSCPKHTRYNKKKREDVQKSEEALHTFGIREKALVRVYRERSRERNYYKEYEHRSHKCRTTREIVLVLQEKQDPEEKQQLYDSSEDKILSRDERKEEIVRYKKWKECE
jgi:hypothetical protein